MKRHAAPPTVRTSALEELARAAAIRRGRRVEFVPRFSGGPVARGVLLRDENGSALVLWDDGAISGCRSQFLKRNTDPAEEVSALSGMTLEQAGRALTEASKTLGGCGRWVVKDARPEAEVNRVFQCDDCGEEFDWDHSGDATAHADDRGHYVPSWTVESAHG